MRFRNNIRVLLSSVFCLIFISIGTALSYREIVAYTLSNIGGKKVLLRIEDLQEVASFKVTDQQENIVYWEKIFETGIVTRKFDFGKLPQGYYPYELAIGDEAVRGTFEVTEDSLSILKSDIVALRKERFHCEVIDQELQIRLTSARGNWVELSIRRMGGKELFRNLYEKPGEEFSRQVDLETFEAGKYIVRAKVEGKYFVQDFEVKK
ncbi:hypothetical protein V6R21_29755 [Limibacter armeniacum]|uniref:hypothetical protein n=1 Tax=Limibacter armeniacum TaxID=466084 RepID=UPI002FE57A1A